MRPQVEDAPEVTAALIAAGLPVERVERRKAPSHLLRTIWTRTPTHREKIQAAEIRSRLRRGIPLVKQSRAQVEQDKPLPPMPADDCPSDAVDAARCQNLARAVIAAAVSDAFNPTTDAFDRGQARAFLMAADGWAEAREFWCAVADFDEDAVRDAALRRQRAEGAQ